MVSGRRDVAGADRGSTMPERFSREAAERLASRAGTGPQGDAQKQQKPPQGTAPCTVPTHGPHSSLLFGRTVLHFQFQLPGGDLAQSFVVRGGFQPLVLNAELPRSI